ncbi:MAG: DUF998 domain-containing protein [Candidatus Thermoplasmatota archaeon]
MQDARRRIRLAAGALGVFLASLAILHVLNWATWPRHISGFVRLPGAWLLGMGLLALAFGLIVLGLTLPSFAARNRDAQLACRLLVVGGFTTLVLILFPTDVTPQPTTWVGGLHNIATAATVLSTGSALFLLVDAGRRDPSWGRWTGTSFVWPGIVMVLGYAWGLGDMTDFWPLAAVFQRALAAAIAGWFIALALRIGSDGAAQATGTAVASAQRP